ncbi:hypothetical protein H8E88_05035 [candidate division KSB1 bacterium]|nr:hypothetical protein [candidate division KSB1 bacterium]MBL7092564.1 hypothetical protein [candidate division KSB1 bacterium]
MNNIELLKFPYPFQAALAICSDIDSTSWDNFLTIHKFLNSNQKTALGRGLSLPVGDSFWMYDKEGNANAAFSYFKDFKGRKSKNAPAIRDLIRAGIIDVLHSYGNFTSPQDFSRKLALQAIEELDKYGLKLKVWTNHGGVESVQNIGAFSSGKGEILNEPSDLNEKNISPYYHSDLLSEYGIKFYWDCELSLTGIVGQNRKSKWSEAYWGSPLYKGFKNKSKSVTKGIISLLDNGYNKISHKHFIPWQPIDFQNALIQNEKLRDGTPIFRFKRFGNGRLDWQDDFSDLLSDKVLKRLLEKHGYLILYIHLGDRKNKNDNLPLGKAVVDRFRDLAELFFSERVWIGTTSRILTYNLVNQNLDWQYSDTDSKYVININGINKFSSFFSPSIDDFQGISFKIPANKQVEVFFNEQKINPKIVKKSTYQIAMFPLIPIEWPL